MEDNYGYSYDEQEQKSAPEYPMKWHKFLIYFSLWLGAVLNLSSAVQYFTGSLYGGEYEAQLVYAFFDGLKAIDTLMGVVLIVIAVLCIITRFALAGYKASGPKLLFGMYLANVVVSILYIIIVSGITELGFGDLMNGSVAGSLIGSIAMAFINKVYYGKRAELFVN